MWYLAVEDKNQEENQKEFSFGDLFHETTYKDSNCFL